MVFWKEPMPLRRDQVFLDHRSVNGIKVIPLIDHIDNHMIYVKRKDKNLSVAGATFVTILKDYFNERRKALL